MIFVGVLHQSEFFTLKLVDILFPVYEFSPYEPFSSKELRYYMERCLYLHFLAHGYCIFPYFTKNPQITNFALVASSICFVFLGAACVL